MSQVRELGNDRVEIQTQVSPLSYYLRGHTALTP